MYLKHIVSDEEDKKPLKNILHYVLRLSTSLMRSMKQTENVLVNGQFHRFIDPVSAGDVITVRLNFGDEETTLVPQDIPIEIIYEDQSLIALNKPMGMVIHPCAGYPNGTLGNALLGYYRKTGQKLKVRPLGRLDRDTTGLIVFAKNPYVQDFLIHEMMEHRYEKKYIGIVHGHMEPLSGKIDLTIARKEGSIIERTVADHGDESITLYETRKTYPQYSVVDFQILTGRTHQIRVHCDAVGNPLLGDTLYGNRSTQLIGRQALHSYSVRLIHPFTKQALFLEAPMPQDMQDVIKHLEAQ